MRPLPAWAKDLKKWMGEAGAMTNLQQDFIFHIEDSLIAPLKKNALNAKAEKELMKEKVRELLHTVEEMAERNSVLNMKLKALTHSSESPVTSLTQLDR